MSAQERISWLSLVINAILATWYFGTVFQAPAGIDLQSPEMARFVARLIAAGIFIAIAGELLLKWLTRTQVDGVAADERDGLIRLKSARNGYIAMSVAIVAVLAQIMLIESMQSRPGHLPYAGQTNVLGLLLRGPLSALLVAQLMLLALTLSGICVYASRIFYYRRGY